jgi:hypothetical protein
MADAPASAAPRARTWFERTFVDLAGQLRWSFVPPLMVYFAAGISGLTAVAGTFFVKDYLDLSAAFLATLSFWAGLPWVLKMPVGHLVDLIWRWKGALVFVGAGLIGASLLIMYGLVTDRGAMEAAMPAGAWYVLAALLAPTGYVVQDVVADAMTVEAVPEVRADGTPFGEAEAKAMHTTMQTLGRFAIISGFVLVALLNIGLFSGTEGLDALGKAAIYGRVYLLALAIPLVSVAGVGLAAVMRATGTAPTIERIEATAPNWEILGGGLLFVAFSVATGLSGLPFAEEAVFAGSLAIVLFLISRLMRELPLAQARALVGTAAIIFVFRATPLPGPGLGWFQIDVLGFDEQFLSILSFITSGLTLVGLVVFRPMMAGRTIAWIVVMLTLAGGVLALPNLGLVYGVHEWTAARTGGAVDARFIAIMDTAIESPLGQIAMVPMLAWIARNAPGHLKATFFAVMASFTNLALSASALATRRLNEAFVVTREVRAPDGAVAVAADYSALGPLVIAVVLIALAVPVAAVALVQVSRYRTAD